MMTQREYVEKLIQCLKHTDINSLDNRQPISYEEGIELLVNVFSEVRQKGNHVFFAGSGGSAAIASHMAADFMKNGKMKTYNLYDNSVTTCMGNDYGYEFIFSKPLELFMDEGDLLVAISSSGNSMNIVNAIHVAKKKNAKVITLSGFKINNRIRKMGDYNIYVNVEHYGIVESVHNLILQQIVDAILAQDEEKM